jgi:hypothetical protein
MQSEDQRRHPLDGHRPGDDEGRESLVLPMVGDKAGCADAGELRVVHELHAPDQPDHELRRRKVGEQDGCHHAGMVARGRRVTRALRVFAHERAARGGRKISNLKS